MPKYNLSIFIFTRDLRLHDNTSLDFALQNSAQVMPIFILNPKQITSNQYKSNTAIQFMCESLTELSDELQQKGSKLYLFYGPPHSILDKLISKHKAEAIFINQDYTPFARSREKKINNICHKRNISFHTYEDHTLNGITTILKPNGEPYVKFTPFYKRAKTQKVRLPKNNNHTNYWSGSVSDYKKSLTQFYQPNEQAIVRGGRKLALKILRNIKNFSHYNSQRDIPSIPTTYLGPHLKFGTISIRETYHKFKLTLSPSNSLKKQLYWRDFYMQIIYHFPHVIGSNMNHKNIPWSNNITHFKAWTQGRTGFPIVDAAMHQLNTTGFMHNRCRMIVASILTKILHIDWRLGERYFATHLIDYDPANNNGGWQWCASTGTDSQPYFRYFNPHLQAQKYDPSTTYIKKWLPDLRNVPSHDILNWDTTWDKYDIYYEPIVPTRDFAKKVAWYKRYF